jgi:hypothetical protein
VRIVEELVQPHYLQVQPHYLQVIRCDPLAGNSSESR